MDKAYVEIVRLLLDCASHGFHAPCFVMKGGTALNLFVEEMPRLSVDIDVVYRDHVRERGEALNEIATALADSQRRLNAVGIDSELVSRKPVTRRNCLFTEGAAK